MYQPLIMARLYAPHLFSKMNERILIGLYNYCLTYDICMRVLLLCWSWPTLPRCQSLTRYHTLPAWLMMQFNKNAEQSADWNMSLKELISLKKSGRIYAKAFTPAESASVTCLAQYTDHKYIRVWKNGVIHIPHHKFYDKVANLTQ